MKTKYERIKFVKNANQWLCEAGKLGYIGVVHYVKAKEPYWSYIDSANINYPSSVLRDIADFIDQLNKEKQ